MSFEYEPPEARQILADYGLPEDVIDGVLCRCAFELAAKIQAARDEVRATDWGRSSRSKRAFLQGMERAQRVIEPGKEATCSDPGT